MNKFIAATLLLFAGSLMAPIRCEQAVTPENACSVSEDVMKSYKAAHKKEAAEKKKKKADRTAFAINATGALAAAALHMAASKYKKQSILPWEAKAFITKERLKTAGNISFGSGLIGAILYKIWKTDEKVIPITVRQIANGLGVFIVTSLGLHLVC